MPNWSDSSVRITSMASATPKGAAVICPARSAWMRALRSAGTITSCAAGKPAPTSLSRRAGSERGRTSADRSQSKRARWFVELLRRRAPPPPPVLGALLRMRHGDDVDHGTFDAVDDAEGEAPQDEAPHAASVARPGLGSAGDQVEGVAEFGDKSHGGRRAAPGVPALALDDFGLSFGEELYDARGHVGS